MRTGRKVKIAACVIALAGLPFAYLQIRYRMHNWTPLDVAVPLQLDVFRTSTFKTDFTGTYIIWLDFDQHLGDQLECEIGDTVAKDCSAFRNHFAAEWNLYTNGKPVVQNDFYHPGSFAGTAEHSSLELGTFSGTRNTNHRLELQVLQASTSLRARHPRLRVEAHMHYWEPLIIESGIALFFFGVVCTVCIAAMVASCLAKIPFRN